MYVTSKAGTEILKSQYEIIDSINGIPTLETDYSQLKHNHTEPMLMLSPAFNDKYIMVLKEQESITESSRLRLTGVHSFIYDFSLDRIYEEYTQYFSLENILTLVFSDTEYEYEVSGSTRYNALEFENFGNNDKMSLINQICDRWELEYRVKGNKVYFADQRGTKTTKQFRYKMNIHDSHVNLDISEGATYIRAYFGKKDEENPSNSTYVEKEMLHPLAEDFGVRHAKPYSNEVITKEETMQRYMKMKIEETWKLSVEIDVLDLSGDGSAEVGDEVWAIDERMDLKYKTRIVEKRDYYDVNDRIYRTKVVLGNKTFIEAVSAQEVTAEDLEYEVRRYTNKRIEQLKAEKDNDFNAIRDTLRSEFSDALAQSKIEVAADFDRMEKLLDTKSDEWTEDFNQSVAESKEYAEQQAQAKADSVQTNLDSFKDSHQQLYDEVTGNILDIDSFLGDKSKTLKQQFDKVHTDFGTLQTDLDSVESDLTTTKTDLQKQLDEARAELDGLEVGGRNLLPNKWEIGSLNGSATSGANFGDDTTYRSSYIPVTNHDLILNVYSTDEDLGWIETWIHGYDEEKKGIKIIGSWNGSLPRKLELDESVKFLRVLIRPYDLEGMRVLADLDEMNKSIFPKLEKGNIATDWTPAPEDTEEKITTLNQQIEFIDGQLSAKLEQTDLLPINNKITEYGNTLTTNAQSIQSLLDKTELHDGDITQWSNETKANAESISQTLTRVEETEAGISQAQTDIQTNADGIAGVIRDVETIDGNLSTLTTEFNVEAGKIETLISKTDGHDTQLTNIVADIDGIETTVAANDDWLGTYGSAAEQTIAGFEQKVWQSDIHNPNMIPFNSVEKSESRSKWNAIPSSAYLTNGGEDFARVRTASETFGYIATYTPYLSVIQGESYTISFESAEHDSYNTSGLMNYTFLVYPNASNVNISDIILNGRENIGRYSGMVVYRYTYTFTASETTDDFRLLLGSQTITTGVDSSFYFRKPKLEIGGRRTPYNNALSVFEQRADELKLAVTDSEGLASVIALSPTAIDMITDELNLTGNLNVSGQIETISLEAIEANFARVQAAILTANVIKSTHIEASTSLVNKLFASSARIDELITKTHFVNEMHALTLNVVDLNASHIRSRLLTANTIEAEWLKGGTALLDKVFATTGMFEHFMAKSGFVTTLSTITLDLHELTIWRPDGVPFIQNGVPSFDIPVVFKQFTPTDGSVVFDGSNYATTRSGTQRFEVAYTQHAGRFLSVGFSANMKYDSQSASSYMGVVIRPLNAPPGTNIQTVIKDDILVFRDREANTFTLSVDLGRPTYQPLIFQLEFYRVGGTNQNTVLIRTGRAWING